MSLYDISTEDRHMMQRTFRFPRFAIFMMLMTLLVVIIAIEMGRTIGLQFSGETNVAPSWGFPALFVPMLAFACIAAAVGYAIVFITGRSGLHRFLNIRPWTNGARQEDRRQ